MTRTQKILGSSVLSLLLLAVTMFSMCSVRMQRLNTDGDIDDLALEEFDEGDEAYQDDLLSKLELIDNEEPPDANQGNTEDFFANIDNQNTPPATNSSEAESFLTPELIENLQSEVNDLQNIYDAKERTADSLRQKVREREFADATRSGAEQTQQFVEQSFDNLDLPAPSTTTSTPNYLDSEVGAFYQDALNDYNSRRFGSAIDKFRNILLRGDAADLADNCQYWIGESYYAQGKFMQSVAEFEKVNMFANGNKVSDAQLMTGLAFIKLGRNQQARSELEALTIFHRNANAASKARRYLGTI